MFAKAQWFRAHHFFFFLAIVGATAAGPCFMMFCAWLAGRVMKKEVVPMSTFQSLSKIAGVMFIVYFAFNVIDVYKMATDWVPAADRSFIGIWGGYYGLWMLVLEFLFLIGAMVILNVPGLRQKENIMVAGFASGIMSIVLNKFNILLHGSSVPNFPWKPFASYNPTIQEWSILLGGIAIMILVYMWCARYLPLFPHLEKQEHHEGEAHA
jgi:Ni/Fe-hydrogenase subunit HybB-like protein